MLAIQRIFWTDFLFPLADVGEKRIRFRQKLGGRLRKMHFIKGLQKTSLVDYPGKVCATLFTAKCNFRCGFCYNRELVLDYAEMPEIEEGEVLDFLKSRKKWIDGACLSGGEPCVHGDRLIGLIKKIKGLGLLVKLDTNGSFPEVVDELINKNLIDYISMDIKAPLERYDGVASVKIDKKNIKKTVDLIKKSKVENEFRTTVAPNLLKKRDIIEIGKWLEGSKKYCIQQFRPEKNRLINKGFGEAKPYSKEDLEGMKKAVEGYFGSVEVRNA